MAYVATPILISIFVGALFVGYVALKKRRIERQTRYDGSTELDYSQGSHES